MLERILRLREAKRHAKRGHYRDAFVALESPALNGHRDAIDLRDRLFADLITRARDALKRTDLPAARDALTTARAAGCATDEANALMTRLTEAERKTSNDRRARDQLLGEVRERMAAGSIAAAHERLEHLAPATDRSTDEMRRWVESETKDLDRYLARCHEALDANDAPGAHDAWRRAAKRFPTNPDVLALRARVRALVEAHALDAVLRQIDAAPDAGTAEATDTLAAVRTFVRDHPDHAHHPRIRQFLSTTEEALRVRAGDALERGEPDAALRVLEPIAAEDGVAPIV